MGYLHTYHAWAGTFIAFVLMALSACAPLQKTAPDPQLFALQEELRYVRDSNTAADKAIKDIDAQLRTLDNKVSKIESTIEESTPDVQKDLEKVRMWSVSTQEAIEDINVGMRALEAKVDRLELSVKELASRPQPAPASEKPAPPEVSREPEPIPPAPGKEAPAEASAVSPELTDAKKPVDSAALHAYEEAYGAYVEQRYDDALRSFKELLNRYPNHELIDNAHYWLGETYYDLEDYPRAILAFKDVVTLYPDADKAPDALLKIGYAYLALDDPSNARMFLKRLIKKYPSSSAATKGQDKLKEIEENP